MNTEIYKLSSKINRIFEKVYNVNESLSVDEKRSLILGFEDGLNEEIFGFLGRWAGNAKNAVQNLGQKTKEIYNNMVTKGKQYYEKGKQLAGQAWDAIQKFATNVVNKVKDAYGKASEYLISNYNSFKATVSQAYSDALNTIKETYNKMKEKSQALAEAVKGIWADILKECTLFIKMTKDKLIATKDAISKWIETNKTEMQKSASEAKSSTLDGMRSLSTNISSLLEKGKAVATDLGYIAVFICVYPIVKLVEGVKAIPGVYESAIQMVKDFVNKEIEEIKTEYAKTQQPKQESLRYIKTFEGFKRFNEEFDSNGYDSHWNKFEQWLSEKDFELYDGREDLYNKFMEVANDDNLASEEKAEQIADYLEDKWGLYNGYMEVCDYLESLFMDEI